MFRQIVEGSPMKKVAYGIAILLALALGGIGVSTFAHKGNALDAESRAYVDQAVAAIAKNWDKNELIERATPELLGVVKPEQLTQLFVTFSRLGKMVEYEGATGEATMLLVLNSGTAISASYIARASFDNGSATFRIGLRKLDGRWLINSFYLDLAAPNRSPKA
jgi:hypothetical protein